MKGPQILVIDDEPQIQKLLEITLEANDFRVLLEDTGKTGLGAAKSYAPELILLDLGLPDLSGHEVLTRLRDWYTRPIIILSVQSAEEEIVRALNNGANDYLVKPFRSGELIARIKSALRGTAVHSTSRVFKKDGLSIDLSNREVKMGDEVVKLTTIEFKLLDLFISNEGRVLTHQYLLQEVWGAGHREQTQYLRVFIAQLRKKIEKDPNNPQLILTESGVGYRFVLKE